MPGLTEYSPSSAQPFPVMSFLSNAVSFRFASFRPLLRVNYWLFYAACSSLCLANEEQLEIAEELDTVIVEETPVTRLGPLDGLLLQKEQIPGNLQSISSEEIQQSLSTSLGDLMNTHLQSVNVNDYQGNPFQMDITYRGFSASPQLGTPQGLSAVSYTHLTLPTIYSV